MTENRFLGHRKNPVMTRLTCPCSPMRLLYLSRSLIKCSTFSPISTCACALKHKAASWLCFWKTTMLFHCTKILTTASATPCDPKSSTCKSQTSTSPKTYLTARKKRNTLIESHRWGIMWRFRKKDCPKRSTRSEKRYWIKSVDTVARSKMCCGLQ